MRNSDFIDKKRPVYGNRKRLRLSFSNAFRTVFHLFLHLFTNCVLRAWNCTWWKQEKNRTGPCAMAVFTVLPCDEDPELGGGNSSLSLGHKGPEMLGWRALDLIPMATEIL